MTTRCINVPVRVPLVHLQPFNLRKGHQVPAWPSIGYSPKRVVAMIPRASGQTETLGHGESAFRGRERGNRSDDQEKKLLEVYSALKSELLHDPDFEFTDQSRQWLHRMLDYNVPRGKLGRALDAISCYKILQDGRKISDEDHFLACVLGWCIQWLQADALIIDDIIDNSYTRRGQLCWCRLPQVGTIATNDAILLQTHIFIILKKHFKEKTCYADLLDLFNEVAFQTSYGQMLDVIIPREKDLTKYNMELYHFICKYKAAYLLMYLPAACGLILAGERLDDHLDVKNILIDISIYFQSVNDYLDCYGDPKITGKIGTDIEEGKCSPLIIKALEHADEEQMKILYENYGKDDPACVARVKEIYASLDVQNMFKEYEKNKFEELQKSVETHPNKIVQAIWTTFLGRMTRIQ